VQFVHAALGSIVAAKAQKAGGPACRAAIFERGMMHQISNLLLTAVMHTTLALTLQKPAYGNIAV
jgi:hypothetical protein